jgi:hypothetical protein
MNNSIRAASNVGKSVFTPLIQWWQAAAQRQRQAREMSEFWEMANQDPRIMGDYLAAQGRNEDAGNGTELASPLVLWLETNRPFVAWA